jgi:hypothetical protein
MSGAFFADPQKPVRQGAPLAFLKPLQSLTEGYSHCGGQAFSGHAG